MKNLFFLLLFVIAFFISKAQVNMPDGAISFSMPIYSYTDNISRLSLTTEFLYTSGKGLEVNEISNCLGTKWTLTGIPVITRMINGLPDDQIEKTGNVFDTTKYPAGYLYNNKSILLGCPTALNKYPIFENQGQWYDDDNSTKADRELDNFQFALNGTSGSFVIDKNFNAIQLNDSRVKVEVITEDQTSLRNIRTSIKEFRITDENGIKYIFSEQETSKLFKTHEYSNGTWQAGEIFSTSYDIPLNQNPYVTTSWYVSKIIDPKTNRFISLSYNTTINRYEYRNSLHTEIASSCNIIPPNPALCEALAINVITPDNQSYNIWAPNTKGLIESKEIQKKEIRSINFPDASHIDFNYTNNRKDLTGTKMLDDITIFNHENKRILKYNIEHGYFIKNEIKNSITTGEEKWARLCLRSIQKSGLTDSDFEKPWQFEYFLGTNTTEDFVPPYFFHAKDPWGYYNGSYSGVSTTSFLSDNDNASWAKVCIYNQAHGYLGGIDMFYNTKNGYAKNGLLRKITNPLGGVTEYQYEQNYYKLQVGDEMNAYDYTVNNEIAVGGVHLSKIIEKIDNNISNDITTEYVYTDELGNSSLWGVEPLKFQSLQKSFWQADGKYFSGSDCKYKYIYPGKVFSTTSAKIDYLSWAYKIMECYPAIKKIANTKPGTEERNQANKELRDLVKKYVINFVFSYVQNILITCLTDPPFQFENHLITFNNNLNGNFLPSQYKRVTKKIYSGSIQSGKTVYEFTSPDDFSLILPNPSASFDSKPRGYMWMYGLPKSVKYYDNTLKLIKSTKNEYNLKKNDVQDLKTRSCNCESYWQQSLRSDQWNSSTTFNEFTTTDININGLRLKVEPYNIVTGHNELKKTTEEIFNQLNVPIVTTTNYLYNPVNNLLAAQNSVNSKGTTIETKNYYIEDYNLANPSNAILNQMKNDNILNVPISSETWQTKSVTTPELLSATVTEFGIAPNGDYKPVKNYSLQTDKPVPQSTIGTFDPDRLIRNPSAPTQPLIIPTTEISYDATGSVVQLKDIQGNRISGSIYGYGNLLLPVASVSNAPIDEVAYTSFEPNDANGNGFSWNWGGTSGVFDKGSPTGTHYNTIGVGTNIISNKNKEYKLSFWANSNKFTITPQHLVTKKASSPAINGWTYYEYDVAPTNLPYYLSIDANGAGIDEVRLYPKNATMVTTAYDPGIGKISECDINNRITYYEYDGLGRLLKVLDENRNIIKTYEYHFKN